MGVETSLRTVRDIQAEYDELFHSQPIRDEDRGYRSHALELLKANSKVESLLDLACGGGYFFRQVRELTQARKVKMTGIDLSGGALEIAKQEFPEAGYAMSVAEKLPFKANSFDAITCLGSFEHFMDARAAVEEMKRVSRSGAALMILVPNMFWYKDMVSVLFCGNRVTRNQTHERFASLGEWKELFGELGLKVVQVKKYNGIAKNSLKQRLKDGLIPLRFSYHFLFHCSPDIV